MEAYIEKKLSEPDAKTQEETRKFVQDLQSKITLYEKNIYDRGDLSSAALKKIKGWRARLLEISRANKEPPAREDAEEHEGLETLRLLNRQLDHADLNKKILDKSTLKLASLDFSTDELDKVIVETRRKFETGLRREQQEYRRLILVFLLFLCLCAGIALDKLRLKFYK